MKRLQSWKGCSAHLLRLAAVAGALVACCIAAAATAATMTISTRTFPTETQTFNTKYGLADFLYAPGVAIAGTPVRIGFKLTTGVFDVTPTPSANYATSSIVLTLGGAGANTVVFDFFPSSGSGSPAGAVFSLTNVKVRTTAGTASISASGEDFVTNSLVASATAATFQVGMIFTMSADTDVIDLNPANPADQRRVFAQLDGGETQNRIMRAVGVSWNSGMVEPDGVTPFPDAPNTQLRLKLQGGDLSGIAQMCVDRGGNQLCDLPFEGVDGVPSGYMSGNPSYWIIEKTPGALFTPRAFTFAVTTEWLPAASRPGVASMISFDHPAIANNSWPIVEGNAGPPRAPTIGTAVAATGQASVSFTAPFDGGSPITSYTVTSNPGGFTASGAASPIVVSGLAGGTTYTFTVTATNAQGTSPASAASNAVVTPSVAGVPGAPTITAITAGDRSLTIDFTPPASDGGSIIINYTVSCTPGGITVTGPNSPIVLTGLTNGTPYSCTVRANNAVGAGTVSASASGTPRSAVTVPDPPQVTRAVGEDGAIVFEFLPPDNRGSSPITAYVATCEPGNIRVSAAASPIRIAGLANGTEYTCSLQSVNASGPGPATAPLRVSAKPPAFPVTVTYNITPTSASAAAQINYRPADVGRNGSVFVFALAPAPLVRNSGLALAVGKAKISGLDTPVPCVLAQMSASGELVGVTSSNLGAAISGVLSAQGASVSILNNASRNNVAGSTFFVGYGPDSQGMIQNGTNRAAVTVPAPVECRPQAPQTGWWWNPREDGRGFSVEVRENNIFFAAFLYDTTGRSTWLVSTGPVSLEGALYSGDLLSASGGQTLAGAYQRFPTLKSEGNVTLVFNTQNAGVMVWPGGAVPIERFDIVPQGLGLAPVAGQPQSGWWWNEQEAGRGFFMEFQGGTLDIAGYMYDEQGNPVWYLTVGAIGGSAQARSFSGSWWSYANGQTLLGTWKPNTRTSTNVAPMTIQFTSAETAVMTLPNGRSTNLRRHRF